MIDLIAMSLATLSFYLKVVVHTGQLQSSGQSDDLGNVSSCGVIMLRHEVVMKTAPRKNIRYAEHCLLLRHGLIRNIRMYCLRALVTKSTISKKSKCGAGEFVLPIKDELLRGFQSQGIRRQSFV